MFKLQKKALVTNKKIIFLSKIDDNNNNIYK